MSKTLVFYFDKTTVRKNSQSIDDKIIRSIRARASASVFSTKDFNRFGRGPAIGQALGRLVKAGTLRRVRHGYYDLPRSHPIIGQTVPDPTAVVQALMKDSGAVWQFTGAYAANLLGLSTQVPAQMVVHTSGGSRRVALGNLTITFRHAAPRHLLGAGRPVGLVLQAIRHLGPAGMEPVLVTRLQRELDMATKRELQGLLPLLPRWMQPVVQEITAAR